MDKDIKEVKEILTVPPDMNWGIEIESDGPNNFKIDNSSFINWKVSGDGGLSEVISPIMHGGSESNTDQIYTVCKKLQELGQGSTLEGGAHVHIGNEYLHSISAVQNLIDIWCNCEKIMFCISNPPGELTRPKGVYYAYPISGMFFQSYNDYLKEDSNEYDEIEKYEDILIGLYNRHDPYASSEGHFRALNLYTIHHTFEFRIANSTVNPNTWVENINLFSGIVKAAKEVTDIQKKPKKERTSEEKAKLANLYRINDLSISENERLEALLNLVVNENQREIYIERYLKNSTLLEQNHKLKRSLLSKMADSTIHYNQTSYREGMEIDGLENIEDVKHRVNNLIREYIKARNSSYDHDAEFLRTYFPKIDQFTDSYLQLIHLGLEDDIYKGLDLATLNYNEFSIRTINLLKHKQKEFEENQQEEKKNREKNRQTKEEILNKSNAIPQNMINLYKKLKQSEINTTSLAKRLGLEKPLYEIDQWGLLDIINEINEKLKLINQSAQSNEDLSINSKTLSMINTIQDLISNSSYEKDYSRELRADFEKKFNEKVQDLIKKSKIERLSNEQQRIKNEKVSFIDKLLGKRKLQKARLENIELRKKIEINKEKNESVRLEDSLADLYSYVKTELGGVFTPEIRDFLKKVNNEPYIMENLNIEQLKLKIAKKSKEYSKKGENYLIELQRKRHRYKTQAMLLENENKRLQLNILEKTIPRNFQFYNNSVVIEELKKTLGRIKKMTTLGQPEQKQVREMNMEQDENL